MKMPFTCRILYAEADEYLIKPNSDNLPERILSAVNLSRRNEKKHIESAFTESLSV